MNQSELLHVIIAILVLTIVIGFGSLISLNPGNIGLAILFGFLIISLNVLAKKFTAHRLDSEVESKIWFWKRYGYGRNQYFKKAIPAGIIFPIFLTAFSLGALQLMTILSFETTALKRRASKRFGKSSYTEMTDFHTGLIAASGIVAVLLLSFVSYWIPGLSGLSKFAAFYAFWNIIPFSQLDGTKIFFGSRVLWSVLAIIILILVSYALILP